MCQSLKNILLNSVGGHRCMPHCIVGRPINSWQEQQQLCWPPPASLVMFPHQPSIRPNTLQWCPQLSEGLWLSNTCLSVCLIRSFHFDLPGLIDFPAVALQPALPPSPFTSASPDCEITCIYRNYSNCLSLAVFLVYLNLLSLNPQILSLTRARDLGSTVGSSEYLNTDSSTKTPEKNLKVFS